MSVVAVVTIIKAARFMERSRPNRRGVATAQTSLERKIMEDNIEVRDFQQKQGQPRRSLVRFWWSLAIVILLLATCAGVFYRNVMAPIDVENATLTKAVGWLALRDLTKETSETRAKLFEMYFGKVVENPDDSFEFDENLDELPLPANLQGVVGTFLKEGDKKLEEWNQGRRRPPFVRIDYVIRHDGDSTSKYIVSSDVAPGTALTKRWQEGHILVTSGRSLASNVERNIQMLFMQWFLFRMKTYDALPDSEKKSFLERCADEIQTLQRFYVKLREANGLAPLTRAEMLNQFERQNEGWCEFAQIDELAKVMWFKDLLVKVVVLQELNLSERDLYPPKASWRTVEPQSEEATSGPTVPTGGVGIRNVAIRGWDFIKSLEGRFLKNHDSASERSTSTLDEATPNTF